MGFFSGSWEMNPYAKKLWEQLFSQYQSGAIPEGILTPIRQEGERQEAGVKQWFGSNMPAGTASGLELANLMKSRASTQRNIGQAGSDWKARLMQALLGLSGQAQYKQPGYKDVMDFLI